MAELNAPALTQRWSAGQTRAQYAAVAWLRWRILINGFRRKGGGGELAARILTIPIAALLLFGPTVGSGFVSWYLASDNMLGRVAWLLWAIFIFSQVININLGQPGTTFDPTDLIRFPMRLRSYVAIRLFFGLLAPANIVVTAMSLAAAVGITVAMPGIWVYTFIAMMIFALTNVLFTRMIFAWIDRWMSTRRAREVFTALIFTFSIGFQYLNVTFNPAYGHRHGHQLSTERLDKALRLYHRVEPVLAAFPPGLTGNALTRAAAGDPAASLTRMAGCAMFAAAFLGVFVLRTRTEFHGENLSDSANAVSSPVARPSAVHAVQLPSAQAVPQRSVFGLSPAVLTVLGKEFLFLRRNTGMFYGLVAPLVMILLFAGRLATRSGWWVFPAALAYTLMGLATFAYNSFGLEGAGIQFFFLAPVRLRDVFLAKNLMNFLTALIEGVAVYAIISYLGVSPGLDLALVSILWAVGTILFSTTVGNFRSVAAPKKVDVNRTSNKQVSPLSALLSLGLLLVAAAFGAGVLMGGRFLNLGWLELPIMALYAAAGMMTYLMTLRTIDRFALNHREAMFEELCKR